MELLRLTDENHDTALRNNRLVASRHFQLLLYVRYVCFRVFLECAATTNGGITENHKRRWLLIQLAPETLLKEPDIFLALTHFAGGASLDYLIEATHRECYKIADLLPQEDSIFCVLDDAQVLTKNTDYFRCYEDPARAEPILYPIVHQWASETAGLIVSGTDISMREVVTFRGRAVAKEGGYPEIVTGLGGFDEEDGRRAYLEKYFPPGFLDTSEGEEVASRVGLWLRGRFVVNAAV